MPKKKVRRVASRSRSSKSNKKQSFSLIKLLIVGIIGFIFALVVYSLVTTVTPPPNSEEDVLAARDVSIRKTGDRDIDQILQIVQEEDRHDVGLAGDRTDEVYLNNLLKEAGSFSAADPGTD